MKTLHAILLALVISSSTLIANAQVTTNVLVGNNLTVGSRGSDVATLQGLLSELGYLNVPFGVPFGYFGPLTRTAVAKYQTALGVTPAAGYFGPITRAAMRSQFSSHNWLTLLGWQ